MKSKYFGKRATDLALKIVFSNIGHEMEHSKSLSIQKLVCVLLMLVMCHGATAQEPKDVSLYKRLGGAFSVGILMKDFLERIVTNEQLQSNSTIKQLKYEPEKSFFLLSSVTIFSQLTSDPDSYLQAYQAKAKSSLMLSSKEWVALEQDFIKSMKSHQIKPQEATELIALAHLFKPYLVKTNNL